MASVISSRITCFNTRSSFRAPDECDPLQHERGAIVQCSIALFFVIITELRGRDQRLAAKTHKHTGRQTSIVASHAPGRFRLILNTPRLFGTPCARGGDRDDASDETESGRDTCGFDAENALPFECCRTIRVGGLAAGACLAGADGAGVDDIGVDGFIGGACLAGADGTERAGADGTERAGADGDGTGAGGLIVGLAGADCTERAGTDGDGTGAGGLIVGLAGRAADCLAGRAADCLAG